MHIHEKTKINLQDKNKTGSGLDFYISSDLIQVSQKIGT